MTLDEETAADTLLRMNEQWGPEGYSITYTPGQEYEWHATYPDDDKKWDMHTAQRLHMALYDHWALAFTDFPGLPHPDLYSDS